MKPTRAQDLFDSLQPEQASEKRKIIIKPKQHLDSLVKKFEKILETCPLRQGAPNQPRTLPFFQRVQRVPIEEAKKCTAPDIAQLLVRLILYRDPDHPLYTPPFPAYAGVFLSRVINQSPADHIVLQTRYSNEPLMYLCYRNRKNLTINGDVGNEFCRLMTSGSVIIYGNAGSDLAERMRGGEIVIHGPARNLAAARSIGLMQGGTLFVNGFWTDRTTGERVRTPYEFAHHVLDYGWHQVVPPPRKGTIFYNGVLVMEDGVFVEDNLLPRNVRRHTEPQHPQGR